MKSARLIEPERNFAQISRCVCVCVCVCVKIGLSSQVRAMCGCPGAHFG